MYILLILILGIGILGTVITLRDSYSIAGPALIMASILFVLIALGVSAKWQFGDQSLTGFIYQRAEAFGYVEYDLRFSEQAGLDAQPSFCVKTGSEQDKAFKELVGSGEKVEVLIPQRGFRLANNPFECNSFAKLIKETK